MSIKTQLKIKFHYYNFYDNRKKSMKIFLIFSLVILTVKPNPNVCDMHPPDPPLYNNQHKFQSSGHDCFCYGDQIYDYEKAQCKCKYNNQIYDISQGKCVFKPQSTQQSEIDQIIKHTKQKHNLKNLREHDQHQRNKPGILKRMLTTFSNIGGFTVPYYYFYPTYITSMSARYPVNSCFCG